jgi:hypothetical protein
MPYLLAISFPTGVPASNTSSVLIDLIGVPGYALFV